MLDFMIIQRPRIKKYRYQIRDLEITRLIEKEKNMQCWILQGSNGREQIH